MPLISSFLAWLRTSLPTECAFCHTWPSASSVGLVCHDCCNQFQWREQQCPYCALPLRTETSLCSNCLRTPSILKECICAVPYAYPWHLAVQQFKFQGDVAWARTMAAILLQKPQTRRLLNEADAMVPMPLAKPRMQERGYNQALLLAKQLRQQHHRLSQQPTCQEANEQVTHPTPMLIDGIVRTHLPQHQAELSRQERLKKMRNVFHITPSMAQGLQNKHVVLIDDVKTTGASLNALAHACLKAGAGQVSAIAFAFTPEN